MESFENRLFDLLENVAFDQLNEEDKLFVLQHSSEKEYRDQQKIMQSAETLVYPTVAPLPLKLPSKKAAGLMMPIPLYKVIAGAAAAIIGVWFFWPEESSGKIQFSEKVKTVVDTVYVTKTQHDTLFLESGKPLLAQNDKSPDTVYIYENITKTKHSKRMLEPGANQPMVVIDESVTKTKGQSLKNDETLNLLPQIPEFGL